ncbi:MAG: terpene cyclase/mutase family protein [Deltaproteobacteria bacterium]|nr:terpene cyclase/mutase family protein [Deltaproteobacteria bacterium]
MRVLFIALSLWCLYGMGRLPDEEKLQSISPPSVAEIKRAIDRGVLFLLDTQNKDGSWGDHTKTALFGDAFLTSRHAFRAAVTAIALSALIEMDTKRAEHAIESGKDWLLKNLPSVRRVSNEEIYNIWAHAFGIQALVRLLRISPKDQRTKIVEVIHSQIEFLKRFESVYGGWGYLDFDFHTRQPSADPTSFMTATVLIALFEAKQAGIKIPEEMVKRAIVVVQQQALPGFSYLYKRSLKWSPVKSWEKDSRKEGKEGSVNLLGGSLGRSQACNVALKLWGDSQITEAVIKNWLVRLYNHHFWLDAGRKRPIPHASYYSVAAYFFYYGHYYGALAIEQLPLASRRPFQEHMARILVDRQENDGSWWDWPLYNFHQAYGTGFALMSLKRALE